MMITRNIRGVDCVYVCSCAYWPNMILFIVIIECGAVAVADHERVLAFGRTDDQRFFIRIAIALLVMVCISSAWSLTPVACLFAAYAQALFPMIPKHNRHTYTRCVRCMRTCRQATTELMHDCCHTHRTNKCYAYVFRCAYVKEHVHSMGKSGNPYAACVPCGGRINAHTMYLCGGSGIARCQTKTQLNVKLSFSSRMRQWSTHDHTHKCAWMRDVFSHTLTAGNYNGTVRKCVYNVQIHVLDCVYASRPRVQQGWTSCWLLHAHVRKSCAKTHEPTHAHIHTLVRYLTAHDYMVSTTHQTHAAPWWLCHILIRVYFYTFNNAKCPLFA